MKYRWRLASEVKGANNRIQLPKSSKNVQSNKGSMMNLVADANKKSFGRSTGLESSLST